MVDIPTQSLRYVFVNPHTKPTNKWSINSKFFKTCDAYVSQVVEMLK